MKWLINWIEGLFRRQGIKTYARALGPLLQKRYGRRDAYSAKQILKTSEEARLPPAYICYGLALFLFRDDFDRVHEERGELCDYDAMRQDIADACFDGDTNFSTDDAVTYGETHASSFDSSDSDFTSVGDAGSD